jgi:hypothetical protein
VFAQFLVVISRITFLFRCSFSFFLHGGFLFLGDAQFAAASLKP